jgi:thiamine pyrophosphate-dependent acetolactate synthase large subunit-like protein
VLAADAEGRLGTGLGLAAVPGRILHLSSKPGGTAAPRTIRGADDLLDAVAGLDHLDLPATLALHLDLDLHEPVDEAAIAEPEPQPRVVMTLDPSLAGLRGLIVAGPGVVRSGSVDALAALAAATGWGVVNSWGAKGVFAWYDPVHFGTAGLQRDDVRLMGLDEVDLVVATGLDPDELPVDALGDALVQEVEPWQLAALTHRWTTTAATPEAKPALFAELSAVVGPMYESDSVPLAPARAALHLAGARPEGGVVVADPGVAGFWLARTYPTREAGSVVVPATSQPGFAVAAALVAGVQGRPCVAVVDGPLDEASQIVAEAAAALEVPIAVQAWGSGGSARDVDAHARVTEAQFAGERGIVEVPIRAKDLDALVDVAGPVTAWGGSVGAHS